MSDLGDILASIQADRPALSGRSASERVKQRQWEERTPPQWTEEDKTKIVGELGLTKYELYWLIWRTEVHLRSYRDFEWSEMKEVLEACLKKLENLWYSYTKEHWYVDTTCTPVVGASVQHSTTDPEALPLSPANDAARLSSGIETQTSPKSMEIHSTTQSADSNLLTKEDSADESGIGHEEGQTPA